MKNLTLTFWIILLAISAHAQETLENFANLEAPYFNINKGGIALSGYDATEYFLSNTAVKGSEEFKVEYQGATYLFASEANKKLFQKNPEKYLPQFGGYCAYGVGMKMGEGINGNPPGKYPVNPETFKIIDNRLYLFYNDHGYNFLETWESNEKENLERANSRWKVYNKE